MPKGPLGFPRITGLGPFVEMEGEQELKIEEEKIRTIDRGMYRALSKTGRLTQDKITRVKEDLVVREELPEADGILGEIERSVKASTRAKSAATATWYESPEDNLGVVGYVHVIDPAQEMGIGTKLKEIMHDHMRDNGVEEVYTEVISDEGEALARKTGYEPTEELDDEGVEVGDIMKRRL